MKMDMHLHSDFSDGRNTIEEMAKAAFELGYEEIAFTDHVWKTTDWIDEYIAEIKRVRQKYSAMRIYSGVEAKVLDLHGNIDIQSDFAKKVDLIIAAFHRIPSGNEAFLSEEEIMANGELALRLWYQALMKTLENEDIYILAHPTAICVRYGLNLSVEMKRNIAKKARHCRVAFEMNTRHRVPDDDFIRILLNESVNLTLGSDSHSVTEFAEAANDDFMEHIAGLAEFYATFDL